jgi:hypothetical protein
LTQGPAEKNQSRVHTFFLHLREKLKGGKEEREGKGGKYSNWGNSELSPEPDVDL